VVAEGIPCVISIPTAREIMKHGLDGVRTVVGDILGVVTGGRRIALCLSMKLVR
jgi:hypothetical protein